MSGEAPKISIKKATDAKIAIVSSSWHLDICNDLIAGAKRALEAAQVAKIETRFVPGSFEIPLAAQRAFEEEFDAVIAVGLVLKGETPHFDYVCQGVTQGIMEVQLKFSKPIGFGVLMCNYLEQAIARSGKPGSIEDKGFDSAIAALSLLKITTAAS
jgi:6,7-dimethyl-8-ribityllumazine synthase